MQILLIHFQFGQFNELNITIEDLFYLFAKSESFYSFLHLFWWWIQEKNVAISIWADVSFDVQPIRSISIFLNLFELKRLKKYSRSSISSFYILSFPFSCSLVHWWQIRWFANYKIETSRKNKPNDSAEIIKNVEENGFIRWCLFFISFCFIFVSLSRSLSENVVGEMK